MKAIAKLILEGFEDAFVWKFEEWPRISIAEL